MEIDAQEGVDAHWAKISSQLEQFYEEHKGLKEMLASNMTDKHIE